LESLRSPRSPVGHRRTIATTVTRPNGTRIAARIQVARRRASDAVGLRLALDEV
jgi:hypothetical protein